MLSLRRSALRILSSSPSTFVARSRTVSSLSSQSFLRTKPVSQSVLFQRRWATGEAAATEDGEKVQEQAEEVAPVAEVVEVSAEAVADVEAAAPEGAAIDARPRLTETEPAPATDAPYAFHDRSNNAERIREPKPAIYLGNLFFDVTEEDLSRELSRFGNIENVRLMRDSRGLSKGFGYIDFDSTEAATAAIEALHGQLFEGRRIVVQYAAYRNSEARTRRESAAQSRGPGNPPSKTLFIGNMSYEMTDRDLNELFRGVKNVVDVRVAIDRRTGQPRGFAHADFIDIKSAMEAAKTLAEKETYGRKLRIDYSFGSNASPRNQGRQEPPVTE